MTQTIVLFGQKCILSFGSSTTVRSQPTKSETNMCTLYELITCAHYTFSLHVHTIRAHYMCTLYRHMTRQRVPPTHTSDVQTDRKRESRRTALSGEQEKMWLERWTLVLLSVSLVISGPVLVVIDEKTNQTLTVQVPLGSSMALECRLKTKGYDRVEWIFGRCNNTEHETSTIPSERLNHPQQESRDEYPTLTLPNVTKDRAGCYSCNIKRDIPTLEINCSGETQVIITFPAQYSWWMDRWIWISLGVTSVLLVVLILTCVLLSRRRCRSRGEEPVYANTRPVTSKQPSPRPGSDHPREPSSPQNIRKQSPCRKYNEGKRRYK